jgi:hypothetical protein
MKYLKETTKWDKTEVRIPAHTYIVSGMKVYGYIPEGSTEDIMFKTPLKFDKRRRSFEEVKI